MALATCAKPQPPSRPWLGWTEEEDVILTRYALQATNDKVCWLRVQHYLPSRSIQQMRGRWKRIRSKDPLLKKPRKVPVRRSPVPKNSKAMAKAEVPFPGLHDYVVWVPTAYDDIGGHAWLDPLFEECEECEG